MVTWDSSFKTKSPPQIKPCLTLQLVYWNACTGAANSAYLTISFIAALKQPLPKADRIELWSSVQCCLTGNKSLGFWKNFRSSWSLLTVLLREYDAKFFCCPSCSPNQPSSRFCWFGFGKNKTRPTLQGTAGISWVSKWQDQGYCGSNSNAPHFFNYPSTALLCGFIPMKVHVSSKLHHTLKMKSFY